MSEGRLLIFEMFLGNGAFAGALLWRGGKINGSEGFVMGAVCASAQILPFPCSGELCVERNAASRTSRYLLVSAKNVVSLNNVMSHLMHLQCSGALSYYLVRSR